jgi:hypothetical protein
MTSNAGVWIDHRDAVIAAVTAKDAGTTRINSDVERHLARTGDSPLNGGFECRQVPADDRRQRALTEQLNAYYDRVIAALRQFDCLILFGPGEAKGELHKRMARTKLDTRVMAIETEDRMTDPQIIAKVRAYFVATSAPVQSGT